MLDKLEGPWKYVGLAVSFPLLFQEPFLSFAWGAQDPLWLLSIKRGLILLPVLAIVASCWLTIACALTLVFRSERREFAQALFITWWDLGRSIFSYWGGIVKFFLNFFGWLYGFLKLVIIGLIMILKDLLFLPIRVFAEVSQGSFKAGIPWPAIFLMLVWTVIEALIFTFVMTPLVVDILDGFTEGDFEGGIGLQIVLYTMFSLFVLGSYAVIHTLGQAVERRDIPKVVMYVIVEVIVAVVETVLFYREFVDALIPWFAQYAGDDFDLGLIGTLSIAFFIWLGFRCMTWFLFGSTAIPTLLAVIQRTGVEGYEGTKTMRGAAKADAKEIFAYVNEVIEKFKTDMDWVEHKGNYIFSSFIIPPLQIIAGTVNFCTLLISSSHLFELPFRSYTDILDAKELISSARQSVKK
ncbi:hypothetical protein [Pseudobacteriovorax antillogorgiicola]|uniref:Uncharacterized protein n=1 Tax=Pseudobacteriovorax antillogorgiicola TaxID=1513793 RepID=A0A1Y6C2Q9_9BACT|nr:hypothetical protein [Pseudobacteriovorax antillogorgiicola]TCS50241.1 hypothetical protein EDD56_11359 [Pseudobacteriovorax antillogorgiicola]SMF32807.1 hypothetical protein SAMN06296036_11058 [Pseudobacteriovorax antillogorgiicola]